MEKMQLCELMNSFEEELRHIGYAKQTLAMAGRLRRCLIQYADECRVSCYTVDLGRRFLTTKYPDSADRPYVEMPHSLRGMRRTIMLLDDYFINGTITRKMNRGDEGLSNSDQALLSRYSQECSQNDCATETIAGHMNKARQFLRYINCNEISIKDISEKEIIGFLQSKPGQSRETIAGVIGSLKYFLKFLYNMEIVDSDLSLLTPQIRIPKLARIPSVWKQGDIEKLLKSIDRGSPVGKRDYAILLTVSKMGFRTGDVFLLKKENINWTECRIELTQNKTKQPISSPLQDDVGWAIIDYLKNGRPDCDSPLVFVSHSNSSMGEPLKRAYGYALMEKYIRQAGIRLTKQQRHGLHSLRHTLATRLLEAKTPLPVISEILGQVSPDVIEKYLKVDIESLRQCALNPEEVSGDVTNL